MSATTRGLKKGSIISRTSQSKCTTCDGSGEMSMGSINLQGCDTMPTLINECTDCDGTGVSQTTVRVLKKVTKYEKVNPAI